MPGRPSKLTIPERKIRDRINARERKRRERERLGPDGIRVQRAVEERACCTWERLLPNIRKESPKGCWVWRGPFLVAWASPRPIIRVGQYGRVFADVAVYLAHTGRRELPRGSYLRRDCGRIECVSPHCARATNHVVERARAEQGGDRHGQQGPQRQARQQLSRAV